MFLLKAESQGFHVGEGVDLGGVAALIEQHTEHEWRSKNNGGVAEKLARAAMQVQDARIDPTELSLEEYKVRASILELADVSLAAEQLRIAG